MDGEARRGGTTTRGGELAGVKRGPKTKQENGNGRMENDP